MARFDVRLRIAVSYTVSRVAGSSIGDAVRKADRALRQCLRVGAEVGDGIASPSAIDFDWPWGADVLKVRRRRIVAVKVFTYFDDAWVEIPRAPKAAKGKRRSYGSKEALAEFRRVLDRRYGPRGRS